jgi:glucose/arabinose dehydrogenase
MIYTGSAFGQWRCDALIGALSVQALIRVDLTGATAKIADTWPLGQRIREVELAPGLLHGPQLRLRLEALPRESRE